MLFPSFDEVTELAKQYQTIPVFFTFAADHRTPISIYAALSQNAENAFILESVNDGTQWDRYSFMGFSPCMEIQIKDGKTLVGVGGDFVHVSDSEPLVYLKTLMQKHTSPKFPKMPYFTGGLIGYFAYDTVRYTEKKLINIPEDDIGMPDCNLFMYDELIAYDHLNSNAIVMINLHVDSTDLMAQYQAAEIRAAEISQQIEVANFHGQVRDDEPPLKITSNMTQEEYMSMVRTAKEYIVAGDIFQVVLSQRFAMENPPDSFEVYRRLRATNPSPYLYYFKAREYAVAGASPEMLVKITDNVVSTRPIAGTMPRGKTREEDLALEKKLNGDEKERAEHTMLVDLGRNDVGKVCDFGTVHVSDFMRTERYSKVMHLVSDVEGNLRADKTPMDALAAVLPAGTLSGAPKVRAMEIIDELENRKRGLYGGTVGYLGFNGDINTCIAIRTVLFQKGMAYVQAGAGIVVDSDPEKEYFETKHKAEAVIRALEEARR